MKVLRLVLPLLLLGGCRQDMHDGAYVEPLEGSSFFADGRGTRPQVAGTLARGQLREDEHLHRGLVDGEPATAFPFEVTAAVVGRGRERYEIHCSPCHGSAGDGHGMVTKRGFTQPPSYHVERLREAPVGYFFDVVTNGFGAMYDLSDRVSAEDRWAIVAYVRALQLSQDARLEDVPAGAREALEGEGR